MMSSSSTYRITPDVPPSYYENLFDFFYTEFLLVQKQRFSSIVRETNNQGNKLSYIIMNPEGKPLLQVEVKSGTPFELKINSLDPAATQTAIEEAKQDVLIAM
ncbi:MAG: hypothetical protein ACM3JE_03050, partial [Betaproteobacteria bacterium]